MLKMGSKCMIFGASGLLGRSVVEGLKKLCDPSIEIIAPGRKPVFGTTFLEADLSRGWSYSSWPTDVETFIFLAQSSFFRDFPSQSRDIFSVNTASLLQALDYARQIRARHFVFASTGGLYGIQPGLISEASPILDSKNMNFYLVSKRSSEFLLDQYAPYFAGISVLRFFYIYGVGQNSTMLIPRLAERVRKKEPITLDGEDGIRINPVYVKDAADATVKAATLEGFHLMNVAGPEIVSLRQIGETLGELLKQRPHFERSSASVSPSQTADISTMSKFLGPPQTTLLVGLKAFLAG